MLNEATRDNRWLLTQEKKRTQRVKGEMWVRIVFLKNVVVTSRNCLDVVITSLSKKKDFWTKCE